MHDRNADDGAVTAAEPTQSVIRITHAEARDPRVDDLLARQANLRGERAQARAGTVRWYYRGWFVLGMAGALAAFIVWAALVEPNFADLEYIEGTIDAVDDRLTGPYGMDDRRIRGRLLVNDQWIWILDSTEQLVDGKGVRPLRVDILEEGRRIGLHVSCFDTGEGLLAFADYGDLAVDGQVEDDADTLRKDYNRNALFAMLIFGLVAAGIGMAIGATEGVICRQPRRVAIGVAAGALVGFVGGYIASFVAGVLYAPLNSMAMDSYDPVEKALSTSGLLTQMGGRGIAWMVAGAAMGLGPGIAMRSGRFLSYGLLGGLVGGLLGGLLFDPIYLLLVGAHSPSAAPSRALGFTIIGASVGSMIGVVELLARNAWLGMLKGPLAGKEFLLFRSVMRFGSSPSAEIYLFNDPEVAPEHAVVRDVGGHYELTRCEEKFPVTLNGQSIRHARLRDGDVIGLGQTRFAFHQRRTS